MLKLNRDKLFLVVVIPDEEAEARETTLVALFAAAILCPGSTLTSPESVLIIRGVSPVLTEPKFTLGQAHDEQLGTPPFSQTPDIPVQPSTTEQSVLQVHPSAETKLVLVNKITKENINAKLIIIKFFFISLPPFTCL